MAIQSMSGKILATSLVAAVTAGGAYAFMVQRRISLADRSQIIHTETIPESFAKSRSVSEIANAGKHISMADSISIPIQVPPQHRDVSDEVLLANFVKGFFGGAVLGPERTALRTLGLDLVQLTKASTTTRTTIWSPKDLSDTQLLPTGYILYGAFQNLGAQITPRSDSGDAPSRTQSHVDFGFGNNQAQFAGVHRFAVVREKDASTDQQTVQIHYQHMSCNPTVNKPIGPQWIFSFHKVYADLLFREGVSEVKRWMNGSE
ncbi:hypothetical protein FZEAL_1219 [Fusarium zealandicum]|uniref:Uncharacterized protein n=1 Tax=Fusarium zealandicum TaxID=1053134 RepID=A0A8H4XPK0_9HYPO|nr:hypothetical protein FZEAL_1219 [Fusarium zealandicum]